MAGRVACVNCRHYEGYWCGYYDTPACPFARCDQFERKEKTDDQKRDDRKRT